MSGTTSSDATESDTSGADTSKESENEEVARYVTFTATQKKSKKDGNGYGSIAELDDYLFECNKVGDTLTFGRRLYWKCKFCCNTMITDPSGKMAKVGQHKCEKPTNELNHYKVKAKVREVAATSDQKPSQLTAPILNEASQLATVPSKSNLAQTVNRVRQQTNTKLPEPKSPSEVAIPEDKQTL